MKAIDIAPFALPNCPAGELRFEEPRDVREVVVRFKGNAPKKVVLSYLQKVWPDVRYECMPDSDRPGSFGWLASDDQFNAGWREAATRAVRQGRRAVITFKGLSSEFGGKAEGYDVCFRRTLGLRIDVPDAASIKSIVVFTRSPPARSTLLVELDAGCRAKARSIAVTGYNVRSPKVVSGGNATVDGGEITFRGKGERRFQVRVDHMRPAHRYSGDAGHVTLSLNSDQAAGDAFTVSLESVRLEGPVWYAEKGVYVTLEDQHVPFEEYRAGLSARKNVSAEIGSSPEQSYLESYAGQPRGHAVSYSLGWKHARQRFWLEQNGDLVLHRKNVLWGDSASPAMTGRDTERFRCRGNARFFFELQDWYTRARFTDPGPVPVHTVRFQKGTMVLEQRALCCPLDPDSREREVPGDETIVALVQFRFTNTGDAAAEAEFTLEHSQDSDRSPGGTSSALVPRSVRDELSVRGTRIVGRYEGTDVLRASFATSMRHEERKGVRFRQELEPGESCECLLRAPYVALDSEAETVELESMSFEEGLAAVTRFWRRECRRGAQLSCPEQHLTALHASHLMHVESTDISMPDEPDLVNTSVGSSTYGNFSNESCMIVQELDQRGLHEEARRRLEVWVRYQGTVPQPGNFTDSRGMYFGAGGFESGAYNQHHGWVLWCLAEHYFLSGDRAWLERAASSMIEGADWVFRQRRNTMADLPHSRGWERGFLPAGSLEDVTDFHYWLSTNALTWRGTDRAARALEDVGHAEAPRIRRESDAYRDDLIRGFERMRRASPLVRLRDGRWVPTYPSRLYVRGRDVGWIREVLEGSVYLLISGLYDCGSREAGWILDDFQDNRYPKPPFGYVLVDPEANLRSRGGFSMQPNLLAGLVPHLERDEIEVYIWMFFNAWVSCYREEIGAMVEHPLPELGFANAAHFKTSDEANAVMWLRYLVAYWTDDYLHVGRALPREWLRDGREVHLTGLATYYGPLDVHYRSRAVSGRIEAQVNLNERRAAGKFLVRFRHPERREIDSVEVNGQVWNKVDRERGDVDLTGMSGELLVTASFE